MVKISLVFFILALWVVSEVNCKAPSSSHHAHAPAPSADCTTLIVNMVDCMSFVSNGSNTSKPEGGCCNGLKTVLKIDSGCLCEAFKNSANYGIAVNITKAMTLPSACRLKALPISNCHMSRAPSAAPVSGAPSAAPGQSPTHVTPAPAPARGSVDNNVPAPAPNDASSSMNSISLVALLVSLVVASCSYF